MTKGEGLIGLLYALKDIIESSAILVITGGAILAFFWIVVKYIWAQRSGNSAEATKYKNQMMMGILLLSVIFGIYSLIALTGAIFGVNSSPSGGIYIQ